MSLQSRLLRTIPMCAAVALALMHAGAAVSAATPTLNDRNLPIYPNGKIESGGKPIPFSLYGQGFTAVEDTSDKVPVVAAWYRQHLPPGFSQKMLGKVTSFKGPGGIVNMLAFQGHTRIVLLPAHN